MRNSALKLPAGRLRNAVGKHVPQKPEAKSGSWTAYGGFSRETKDMTGQGVVSTSIRDYMGRELGGRSRDEIKPPGRAFAT